MSPALFTRPAFKVPHDRVGVHWILVVHQALVRAFEIIRGQGLTLSKASLSDAGENDITVELEHVLNNQVQNRGEVEGFDSNFFGKVRRVEVVNYNSTKKSKRPDLCFELRREHRFDLIQEQDALFAECKPVDRKHKLKDHYCAVGKDCTGIERFIIGDYAWAMEQAFMIAYVQDGFRIHPDLAAELAAQGKRAGLGEPSELQPVGEQSVAGIVLYKSVHRRAFQWTHGPPASPIALFHSWHDCTTRRESG